MATALAKGICCKVIKKSNSALTPATPRTNNHGRLVPSKLSFCERKMKPVANSEKTLLKKINSWAGYPSRNFTIRLTMEKHVVEMRM